MKTENLMPFFCTNETFNQPFNLIVKKVKDELRIEINRDLKPIEMLRVLTLFFKFIPEECRTEAAEFAVECVKILDMQALSNDNDCVNMTNKIIMR